MDKYIQLESDENIFTDIIERLGAKNVQVSSLGAVDEDSLTPFEKIYGAILLFPYTPKYIERSKELFQLDPSSQPGLSFIPQVNENSCGMMAILHVLLNINDSAIIGQRLSSYKDFFEGVTADIRGESIAHEMDLMEINNDYEMHHPIVLTNPDEKSESNHYCAFVPFMKVLYQLDGMLNGPVVLESFDTEAQYRQALISTLQNRIHEVLGDDPTSMSVAVLLVHESFLSQYKRHLDAEQRIISDLRVQLTTCGKSPVMEAELTMHEKLAKEILADIESEQEKVKDRKTECELMRMNSIPLLNGLLSEYIYDAMKKGQYKPVEFAPIYMRHYDDTGSSFEDGTMETDDPSLE